MGLSSWNAKIRNRLRYVGSAWRHVDGRDDLYPPPFRNGITHCPFYSILNHETVPPNNLRWFFLAQHFGSVKTPLFADAYAYKLRINEEYCTVRGRGQHVPMRP